MIHVIKLDCLTLINFEAEIVGGTGIPISLLCNSYFIHMNHVTIYATDHILKESLSYFPKIKLSLATGDIIFTMLMKCACDSRRVKANAALQDFLMINHSQLLI